MNSPLALVDTESDWCFDLSWDYIRLMYFILIKNYIQICHYNICKSRSRGRDQCPSPLKLWVRTPLGRSMLDTTLCDKTCQWLATGRWFSPCTPVSSTNKTDRRDITEILLQVALNTITPLKSLRYPLFSPSSII